jgi:quinoprotein glucose dehydrogenase
MRRRLGVLALALATGAGCAHAAPTPPPAADTQVWDTFNGDLKAQKFATETQITPDNVGRLKIAWQLHTGDLSDGGGGLVSSDWSATPLFANDTLYIGTPFYRIFAVAPDTGHVKWIFDTHSALKPLTQPDLKTRGVAYWGASQPVAGQPCQKIVYMGTMDARLFAVDADTGAACAGFGANGVLDINQWNKVNAKWPLSVLQPPTVYKDTLFIGWAGKDWVESEAPAGDVFAVDARTGALKWTFDALPKDVAKTTGTANVWASMSVDAAHNLLFLPVSSPSPNFYGGNREEALPLGTSVTALNADTGAVVWSRQLVHHDLWDFDTNSAPVLLDIRRDGQTIPALAQTSKQGYIYVLNRLTGEPLFPITETPVPRSDIAGEASSPTQPETAMPPPTLPDRWPGVFPLADAASFGECSREAAALRYDGKFTPPSLQGTLTYPGTAGGTEWGGGALDPASNTFVVNSSRVVEIYQLLTRQDYDAATKGGTPPGYFPMNGVPYGFRLRTFLNWLGMPCWKPPYGTLAAYDLNAGTLLWQEPFGDVREWGLNMPRSWGSVTIGGPVITKSGLIFIGASMDSRVRAIDLKTGKVLWQAPVQAPAVALPAIFTMKGREYVVFAAGGNSILEPRVGDQLIAFTLPD